MTEPVKVRPLLDPERVPPLFVKSTLLANEATGKARANIANNINRLIKLLLNS
jgi:hypothetical protein